MGKFYGKIGFGDTVKTEPGVWENEIQEKDYFGDVLNVSKKWQNDDDINGDLRVYQRISIICDLYAASNLSNIKYAVWQGTKWSVKSVEFKPPRLILTLGGVYNA